MDFCCLLSAFQNSFIVRPLAPISEGCDKRYEGLINLCLELSSPTFISDYCCSPFRSFLLLVTTYFLVTIFPSKIASCFSGAPPFCLELCHSHPPFHLLPLWSIWISPPSCLRMCSSCLFCKRGSVFSPRVVP